jgi:hypothetical protein
MRDEFLGSTARQTSSISFWLYLNYAIRSLVEEQSLAKVRLKCPWPNNNQ